MSIAHQKGYWIRSVCQSVYAVDCWHNRISTPKYPTLFYFYAKLLFCLSNSLIKFKCWLISKNVHTDLGSSHFMYQKVSKSAYLLHSRYWERSPIKWHPIYLNLTKNAFSAIYLASSIQVFAKIRSPVIL